MWNRTTAQLVLVFLVAAGVAGCNDEGRPVDSITAPPVPARLAEMDADLIEQIERRVSAVREAPDDAERWGLLGLLYEAHEIYEPALECYERAAALNPEHPRAWYHLALMQNEVGDLASAIVSLERVNELEASYVPAWWQRGRLFLELGRLDEAESAFLEARDIAPRAGAPQAGLARVALQRGDAEEAVRILEALIAGGEDKTYLHHLLGSAYRQLQQWERAEIELMKGREGREVWPDPWGHEAMAHRVEFYGLLDDATGFSDSGQSEAAIPVMEDLLRKKPEDRRTIASLARAYLRVGRTEDGMRMLNRMLELYPDHFETGMNMAAAYEYLGDLDQAMTHVNRSIELNPNYAPTHRRRGSILSRQGLFKLAAAEYEQAVRLAPNDQVAWRSLGDCHVQLGQWAAAATSLGNSLRLEPEDAKTLSKLGFARMQLGDFRGAEAALQQAIRLSPEDGQAARLLLEQIRQLSPGESG
jgi:pentatricopeptide repeat protein